MRLCHEARSALMIGVSQNLGLQTRLVLQLPAPSRRPLREKSPKALGCELRLDFDPALEGAFFLDFDPRST